MSFQSKKLQSHQATWIKSHQKGRNLSQNTLANLHVLSINERLSEFLKSPELYSYSPKLRIGLHRLGFPQDKKTLFYGHHFQQRLEYICLSRVML